MSLLCLQSVFETKILILQPSPVLRKIVCVRVYTETVFCFPGLANRGSGHVAKLRIQYMEAKCKSQTEPLQQSCWGELIRDKIDELERGIQGDNISSTRKKLQIELMRRYLKFKY